MTADPHGNQPVLEAGIPLPSAAAVVVLLHGRGASAEDILGLADAFDQPTLAYLAPQAANHSWYPYSFLAPFEQNEPWISSALNKVGKTIEYAEKRGIRREKVIVAGFSQGACLATEFVARSAVESPGQPGGLIAYTGGLIGPPGSNFQYPGNLAKLPAFLGSGDPDPHVPWGRVQESASILSSLGAEVVLKRYPGLPHTISEEEIAEGKRLIAGVLASVVDR